MRFEFTENPLETVAILDDEQRRILRKNVHIDLLEDKLVDISIKLEDGKEITKEDTDFPEDDEIERKAKRYESWLSGDTHGGDCTSMSCGCPKCHAEEFAEVDTIPDLKTVKYTTKIGYDTHFLFREYDTLDEAIEHAKGDTKQWLMEYRFMKRHTEWVKHYCVKGKR